jgi:hypothetical protein
MGFFSLPAELRFRIYSYFAVPQSAPFSNYRGLYSSCRQIMGEIDEEGGRIFRKHVNSLQIDWKAPRKYAYFGAIPVRRRYSTIQHLRLALDPHAYHKTHWKNDEGFFAFIDLHLESLTLSLYAKSASTASWEDDGTWLFYWIINQLERRKMYAQTRRIMLQLPPAEKKTAPLWSRMGYRIGRYRFRWIMEPGSPICGVWELKTFECGENHQRGDVVLQYLQGLPYMEM